MKQLAESKASIKSGVGDRLAFLRSFALAALFLAAEGSAAHVAAVAASPKFEAALGQTGRPKVVAPPDVSAPPADAITTTSGVAMKTLQSGRGMDHPVDNDCVRVQFTGWKRDGTLLSDSRSLGEAPVQCLQTAVPGVAEVLKLMVVGEKRCIWVPKRLGFTSDDPNWILALFGIGKPGNAPYDSRLLRLRP